MALNFDEIEKSKFVCLKLPDSIYFGEIAYVDEKGKIVSKILAISNIFSF